ncbi:hypothetical protein [Galbibacter orientalis]|uniref:hypothetical protein n=1 Tax=Galbibacter orientalis TaxID=453852 RepID=UPI0030806CB5
MQLQIGELKIIDNALHINDGQKRQYIFLKIVLFLGLINGTLNLYHYFKGETHYSFLLIVIGLICAFALIWIFQFSNKEIIAFEEIKKVKLKKLLKRKSFIIYLKSGRKREILLPKYKTDSQELISIFRDRGFLQK